MQNIPREMKQNRASEKGFSLVVVLFFVGLVAAMIAMSTRERSGAVQRDQARAAGWHLAQVSKAARVYVRDRSLTDVHPYHKSVLASGGVPIDLDALKTAGLLPDNFPDTNIFGQQINIYAANYPVGGDPASHDTVASAYVFLNDARQTRDNPSLVQYIVEGARQNGLFVNAPIFSANGTNISDSCRGSASYASWDTGCLTLADTGMITNTAFLPGAIIVPAWRADIPDTRAVMRFPQPENNGYATMMTALEMAPVARNADRSCVDFVQVYDYRAGNNPVNTGLCRSASDGVSADGNYDAALDRRMDILNVSQMTVDTVVAAPQNINAAYGTRDMSFRYDGSNNPVWNSEHRSVVQYDYNEVFHVTGSLETGGNVVATARMDNPASAPDGSPLFPVVGFAGADGMAWTDLSVDHNVHISNNMTVQGVSNISRATANTLNNDLPGANAATVRGQLDAPTIDAGTIVIPAGGAGYATAVMNANNATITTRDADFFTRANAANNVLVTQDTRDGSVPAAVIYRLQGEGNVNASGQMNLQGSMSVGGNATIQGGTSIGACMGGSDCPDITPPPGRPLD